MSSPDVIYTKLDAHGSFSMKTRIGMTNSVLYIDMALVSAITTHKLFRSHIVGLTPWTGLYIDWS